MTGGTERVTDVPCGTRAAAVNTAVADAAVHELRSKAPAGVEAASAKGAASDSKSGSTSDTVCRRAESGCAHAGSAESAGGAGVFGRGMHVSRVQCCARGEAELDLGLDTRAVRARKAHRDVAEGPEGRELRDRELVHAREPCRGEGRAG